MLIDTSWLTVRDLEYVVALARIRHFGKAAKECGVSQPGLSAQIRKIEEHLETPLFERSSRHVVPTAVGEQVAAQARLILEEVRKIPEIARGAREPLTGEFRLGAIATLGPYFLPRALGPIRRAFPKLKLQLREGLTDNLLEELRSGTLDAVLASPTFRPDGFRQIPLFFERFVLAAPKDHPLATKRGLKPADLRADEMVILEDGHCLKDQTLQTCPARSRAGAKEFHATSLETLRHLVATGHGYTLMPEMAVTRDPGLGTLVTYQGFEDTHVGRDVILVCRERDPRVADMDALAATLKKAAPK